MVKYLLMKLCRITVGTKWCDGSRENKNLTRGFYFIGITRIENGEIVKNYESIRKKKEKMLREATHFIVYWGKKCAFIEKRGKFIGIYKNSGFFAIDSSVKYKLLTGNNNLDKLSNDEFNKHCKHIDKGINRIIGVYLNNLYEGELKMPNNVAVIGDFGNIKNKENISYIERILEEPMI